MFRIVACQLRRDVFFSLSLLRIPLFDTLSLCDTSLFPAWMAAANPPNSSFSKNTSLVKVTRWLIFTQSNSLSPIASCAYTKNKKTSSPAKKRPSPRPQFSHSSSVRNSSSLIYFASDALLPDWNVKGMITFFQTALSSIV